MRWPFSTILTSCALCAILAGDPARALDPDRSIAQYVHKHWTTGDGAPQGITALAQGPSGYLWVGSRTGLYRFDGKSFEQVLPNKKQDDPSVTALMVSRDGDVWVGYGAKGSIGTSVFRNGVLLDVAMPDPAQVMDFVQTADGSVWATLGRKARHLMRFQHGRWSEVGTAMGFPDENLGRMLLARDGTIWVSTENSVWMLPSGADQFQRTDEPTTGFGGLAEDASGNIWLSDKKGSRALVASHRNGKQAQRSINYPVPGYRRAIKTVFDQDGNLWGKTQNGIFRVRDPSPAKVASGNEATFGVEHFQAKDGLSSDLTYVILKDREGSIWIGTEQGLDRFRNARVVTEPKLTKRATWGDVLVGTADGSVYIGEAGDIYRVRPGGDPESVFQGNEPLALCEGPDDAVWTVFEHRLVQIRGQHALAIDGPATTENEIFDCAVDRLGQIWLAAGADGIFSRVGGRWQRTRVPPSLGGLAATTILRSQRDQLLVGFNASSLGVVRPPHNVKPLIKFEAAFGEIRTLFDTRHGLLFGMNSGIGLFDGRRTKVISRDRVSTFSSIAGITQTDGGETWLIGDAGIVRVSTELLMRAFADPDFVLTPKVLDYRDGLNAGAIGDSVRAVAKAGDGRIWFATRAGTVWVDPLRLFPNTLAPPVAIGRLTAGGRVYIDPKNIRLPAGTKNIEIGYAVLSLSIPERVRVMYKLDGEDSAWIDPGQRRQAFYTNLDPGHYSFRVIGANDDGVWNRKGAVLEIDIPPTFLQSDFFKMLCLTGTGMLLWSLYILRVRQIKARMHARLEDRMAEREQIARDLHDTLLQGFQGLILRFQAAANEIPEGLRARTLIETTLDSADDVLSAGRENVKHLRAMETKNLATGFAEAVETLQRDHPVEFSMVVEGTPRELHPIVYEELYRIGNEALINAFRHARAQLIELAISYQELSLSIGVRDNGIGIDAEVIERGGRQGHFGLVGMRERARQIHSNLAVSTRNGGGTEVKIIVPGQVAYLDYRRNSRWWRRLWHKLGLGPSTGQGVS